MAETLDGVAAVSAMLTEHGSLSEDQIEQRLHALGVTDPEDVMEEALDELVGPARQLMDDRWVWLPSLLAGRIFTHRVGPEELAHDLLTVTPDLDPITALLEVPDDVHLVDGAPAYLVLPSFDHELLDPRGIPPEVIDDLGVALLLAPGALGALGVQAGDLVGVRLGPQGLALERVTDPNSPSGEAVGTRLAATLEPDDPVYFDAAVWAACVEDPALFTAPVAPLSEIATQSGLAFRGEWLAPGEFDFNRWDFENDCQELAERHDLELDDAVMLNVLVNIYLRMAEDLQAIDDEYLADASGSLETALPPPVSDELFTELGVQLDDPWLAQLLLEEILGHGGRPAALSVFAETMESAAPRSARVTFRWLRAVALEQLGDIEGAERELSTAESMNTDWPPALLDLARFAADRGDVERALALLRRAGAGPDHPKVQLLEQHRVEARNDLGRNESCWCGSGRKYKKCHLGREQLPLADRAGWLYSKAVDHLVRNGWEPLFDAVSDAREEFLDPDADPAPDPLPLDAVLFEGGAFAEFLQVRGSLLPDDERLLAEQWLLVDRSVFEVEQVHRGHGVTMRDVRTGDTHEVRERTASRLLKPGQLICTRVVPAGDSMQFFGGLEPIELHERDALIELLDSEPDPVELVAFLSRRFAPPTLVNNEGHPLVICEATVRVGDVDGIGATLDGTFDRVDGAEPPQWLSQAVTDGVQRVRAFLTLEGDTLTVSTTSAERMDDVLATLTRVDPASTVLDDTRHPVGDAGDIAALADQLPSAQDGLLDPDDPEMAGYLDEFIRDYETKWLDEPIPALRGVTPRQAAADPTRRGDLIKLLDSFPVDAGPGTMSVDRLRAALGLG